MKRPFDTSGALTCARYAFAPNYYHYCGPDTQGAFGEYVAGSAADGKLVEYIANFETLYPYLKAIAAANHISDPLDYRVVQAYWVGNFLLNKVRPQETYTALTTGQQLHRRLDQKNLKWLLPKIDQHAKLHHSFHVFNIFTRTGHHTVAHTVETMDQCRIGWGQVLDSQRDITKKAVVTSQKLTYRAGRLIFVPATRTVINPIEDMRLTAGDWVSFHWGYVCEKITTEQKNTLEKLTHYHLGLANKTL